MLKSILLAGYTFTRLTVIKYLCSIRSLKYSTRNHFGNHVMLEFDKGCNVELGRDIGVRNNTLLSARSGATLKLGNNVFLNNGCQVVSHESIIIADNVKCGQNTIFIDHDYDYRDEKGLAEKRFITSPISVGRGTWIGANCVILRGTTIGENCVIGAGSVVKGNIPNNHILYQKRETLVTKIN